VKHSKIGRWYKQDNVVRREKVDYVFRDLLADQYKSSSKSKVARRRSVERQEKLSSSIQSSSSLFGGTTMIMYHQLQSQQHIGMMVGTNYSDDKTTSSISVDYRKTETQSLFTSRPSIISDIMIRPGAFLDE
jgi:hypothetical protein